MPQGDRYQLAARGSLYGVTTVNLFNYECTSAASGQSDEEGLAAAFQEHVLPSWMNAISSSFMLHCLLIRRITSPPGTPYEETLAPPASGSLAAAALPASRVLCHSEYSDFYNRSGRGRRFISGIPEESEEDNAIDEAFYDLQQDFAAAAAQSLNGGNNGSWVRVIHSVSAGTFRAVQKIEVSPQIRTLRGRTPRLCG